MIGLILARLEGRVKKMCIRDRLWIVCSVSALAAGLNPNGFHIVPVLLNYHRSVLTSNLLEWGPPSLWPPTAFSLLLVAAAVTLLWAHRGVRVVDWLLFLAFAVAALSLIHI